MKKTLVWWVAVLSFFPQTSWGQADCNAIARDLVIRNFQSNWSDYSKLLFLSTLTTMDVKSAGERLEHVGNVSVGPIKIGPSSWSKTKQDWLRSELQKIINVEQLNETAASLSASSGDPGVGSVVRDCFRRGGFHITLKDRDKDAAVAELVWQDYPGAGSKKPATILDVTVLRGTVQGGHPFAKQGAELNDRISAMITIKRDDPKQGLSIIVNTDQGAAEAYLPPSELPPAPPLKIVRKAIEAKEQASAMSGGSHICGPVTKESCVYPQHGGKIVVGTGSPKIIGTAYANSTRVEASIDTPEKYCVTLYANTGACGTLVSITGVATATEEYAEED
jgi:hypothetical protein